MLRAAGDLTGQSQFVLVGSAAVIAWAPDLPEVMAMTSEIDIFGTSDDPEGTAFEIDSVLGQGSMFHDTHGYFVDGVSPDTARLPTGWRDRARSIQTTTGDVTALVPEPDDIAASKLVRCSDKDLNFLVAGFRHGIFDRKVVIERARSLDIADLRQGTMDDKIRILLGRLR
ncbi:MAG: hypothetical protein Q7T19_02790 [Caulobacter sp.]|nr:hypothetical protein [Caulobacter sp.]